MKNKKRARPAKRAAKKVTKKIAKFRDPNRLGVIEVATIIEEDYQRARHAMLKGVFGPAEYNSSTRRLTVDRTKVSRDAWHASKSGPHATKQSATATEKVSLSGPK